MISTLAHLTNEPHISLTAALLVLGLGIAIGVCLALACRKPLRRFGRGG